MVFIKTIIELFDVNQIDNIAAAVHLNPQKLIFIGFESVMTDERKADIKNFFVLRGITVETEYIAVEKHNISDIIKKTNKVIDENPDVSIDLTGGKELLLVAMGIIATKRNIPMFQFNITTGDVISVNNFPLPEVSPANLTCEEFVALYGGAISSGEPESSPWVFSEDFYNDILKIWEICRHNTNEWNRHCGRLQSYINGDGAATYGLQVEIDTKSPKHRQKDVINKSILNALLKDGLLTDYSEHKGKIRFKYKNRQVMRCLTKAGNALELYAFSSIGQLISDCPGIITSAKTGVHIDWNGDDNNPFDVKNEVDIMLLCNMVPVFISCKNGEVHKEDLYELLTVAEKFGGKYAKKILLATDIPTHIPSGKYLLKRAEEMNILIINNVDNLSRDDFICLIKNDISGGRKCKI